MEQSQSTQSFARRHQTSVDSIITLFEWLLVAFILALMFMTFAMQAFQIPTGSMAETLRGAHYTIRCSRCGYTFDVSNDVLSTRVACPACRYHLSQQAFGRMKHGDRIFVLKSIYQFFAPQRWDVVVFKNPTDPSINYIKRLTGLPNETVQIVNGDLYIDGKIQHKPVHVQEELWMPVCLTDHQPLSAAEHFNELAGQSNGYNTPWRTPFESDPNSAWQAEGTVFTLADPSMKEHTLVYSGDRPDEFRANYAYNNEIGDPSSPVVTDLMIRFYVKAHATEGAIGAALEKKGVLYSVRVSYDGVVLFSKTENGTTTPLRAPILTDIGIPQDFTSFEFANVDRRLVLRWAGRRFACDLPGYSVLPAQEVYSETPPAVHVIASGPAQVRHIELYRDTYYGDSALRANAQKPFTLQDDEFFVCGDNSNNSFDARLWDVPGVGNKGDEYRKGIVPRDYMMGKAIAVYWAQALQPFPDTTAIIPNLETLKVIYGGSNEEY